MIGIEDRHARFLSSIRPRLDNLAPLMVSEHGRGFWTVLDPPRDGADSRVAFLPEGPGLAALESPELAEVVAELLARYDPAYVPPPDLPGPFDPVRDHLLVIFEGGRAYLYRLDNAPHATKPLLTIIPAAEWPTPAGRRSAPGFCSAATGRRRRWADTGRTPGASSRAGQAPAAPLAPTPRARAHAVREQLITSP